MFKMTQSKVGVVALALLAGCAGGSAKDTGEAGPAGRAFSLGESFVYDVDSSRAVSMGGFSAHLRGELALTVVGEAEGGAHVLRGDLRGARYEQVPAEDISADLEQPFFFTVLPDGKVQSFRFSSGIASSAAAQQRELALSLQIVEPGDGAPAEPVWRTVERDSTGDYDASYTRDGGAIHKVKVAYLPKGGDASGSPIAGIDRLTVESSADFTLDANDWPRTVSERESTTAVAGTLQVVSTKSSTARLVRVEERPALVGSMEKADLVEEGVLDAKARALAKIQSDQGFVAGRTFDQIAEALRAADSKTHNSAILAMAALLRLDPSAAAAARAEMLGGRSDLRAKKRLAAAMGSAGTPEAQRALASFIDASLAPSVPVIDAITALALTRTPTPETAAALLGAMSSGDAILASTATLATGAVVRAMTQAGSADAAPALDALVERLARAATPNDKELCLRALGNTGHPRALAAIEPYLTSDDVALRAAAVHGVRFMIGEAADRAVVAGLSDPDESVQAAAADTLRYRPIEPVLPAVEAWLAGDLPQTARTAALRGLSARRPELLRLADHGAEEPSRIARAFLLMDR